MKNRKLRKFHGIPVLMIALAVSAVIMVLSGSVVGSRAVLVLDPSKYDADVSLTQGVAVSLKENGKEVSGADKLMTSLVKEGESFLVGKEYTENIAVSNTGTEPAFVRVTITRYWETNGEKNPNLDPSLIKLSFADGWTVDESANTSERIVLYRNTALPAGEDSAFATGLTIDSKTGTITVQTEKDGVVTNEYAYNDAKFMVEVKADAVQTHSAEAAVKSAWGRSVTVSGDSLTLN